MDKSPITLKEKIILQDASIKPLSYSIILKKYINNFKNNINL